ncbi:MAG TPA: TPM domain-containing protein, partial [Gemmatimonadaceae bacterium]|nr:TPM domain-containing protein [Gemmatimonadaceae bacterium]
MGFSSIATLITVLRAVSVFLLQGFQIPAPLGVVNDYADVIKPDAEARIERIAEEVRSKSRGEIAVVTLPDIGTRDVQEI